MQKKAVILMILFVLMAVFLIPFNSLARIYLFDRKIEIVGKIEEKIGLKYHMKSFEKGRGELGYLTNGGRYRNPAMLKTHVHLEVLAHLYQSGDTLLDFYSLWEWFYDFSLDIHGDMHRMTYSRDRNRNQTPHGKEMAREFYLNFVSGPWTLRLGKQMVVWGETSLERTADVINPLDMRSHMMGMDDWEDFKKGLWMFRGFYQTPFANDFVLEVIWVPHDPKVMTLPPEGTFFNSSSSGGFFSQMQRRWKYDEPNARGLHHSQGGIRIRGYNWDWDWTLLYYNGYNPAPTMWDWGQRGRRSYVPTTTWGWRNWSPGGFLMWAGEKNNNFKEGRASPRFPDNRCFKYYRVDNCGATATKYFDTFRVPEFIPVFGGKMVPISSQTRIEFAYRIGVPFNRTTAQEEVYGKTEKDHVAYGLEITRDFNPWWICRFNDQRSVDITFSIFQDWILGHSHHIDTTGFYRGAGDRSVTRLGLSITTDWMKQELMTMCTLDYGVSGFGNFWLFIQYAPGDHWRYVFLPNIRWSNSGYPNKKQSMAPLTNNGHKGGRKYTQWNDNNNYLIFKIIYMF
jgi:hypothetical protein